MQPRELANAIRRCTPGVACLAASKRHAHVKRSVDLTVQAKAGTFEWKAQDDDQWPFISSNDSAWNPGGERQSASKIPHCVFLDDDLLAYRAANGYVYWFRFRWGERCR